jgi:hypothetical protein
MAQCSRGRTNVEALREAMLTLRRLDIRMLGTVMNSRTKSANGVKHYGYGYSYEYAHEPYENSHAETNGFNPPAVHGKNGDDTLDSGN